MSGAWAKVARSPGGRWSFWKFNWLANHKVLRALERVSPHASGALLDVGCGSMPFSGAFRGRVERYVGVDLPGSHDFWAARPHVFGAAERLPFRAGSFDTVLAVSLLNYLPDPGAFLAEARRVVRPGGVAIVEFPQMLPLDDEDPDYFRFTRHGAERLLREAGFEPLEFVPVGSLPARVGLSTIAALGRINRGPWRVLTEIPVRLLYVVVQLGCEALDRVMFNPDETLANVVVARRTGAPETRQA
jgi:SAM-dependent methyltransferase